MDNIEIRVCLECREPTDHWIGEFCYDCHHLLNRAFRAKFTAALEHRETMLAEQFRAALETAIAFGEREGLALLCAEVFDLKNALEKERAERIEAQRAALAPIVCSIMDLHTSFEKHKEETAARLESLRRLLAARSPSCDCCAKF